VPAARLPRAGEGRGERQESGGERVRWLCELGNVVVLFFGEAVKEGTGEQACWAGSA
jgi:hypothetical protein